MEKNAGLTSVHLEGPRRQEFRHVRNVLLDARGHLTKIGEMDARLCDHYPATVIPNDLPNVNAPCHWLADEADCLYPLRVGVNTMGRWVDNELVVADACVSRRHCAILVHASSMCEIFDLASRNGTFLNSARLRYPTCLKPGDEIRLCENRFIFRSRHAPDFNQSTRTGRAVPRNRNPEP